MTFRFEYDPEVNQPRDKKEYTPLCEGEAIFCIKSADYKIASTGKKMVELKIWVTDCQGTKGTIFDNLMPQKSMAWKTRAITAAIGKPELYNESGELDLEALIEQSGECVLKMKPGTNGYPDRMRIDSYLEQRRDPSDRQQSTNFSAPETSSVDDFFSDDSEIPF